MIDHRSRSGFLIYLGDMIISWSSKKQPSVARSSTESEFCAIIATTAEIVWIMPCLTELGITIHSPSLIKCYNLGVIHFANNSIYKMKMKHVALDFHFVQERVEAKRLSAVHIPNTLQVTDILRRLCSLVRSSLSKSKSSIISDVFEGGVLVRHNMHVINHNRLFDQVIV